MKEWEKTLEKCIYMMDKKNREELPKLRNAYEEMGAVLFGYNPN